MSFKSFAIFALLGLGYAKPTPAKNQVLSHDDVLILRDNGEAVVMKSWDYSLEEDKREVQRRKAGLPPRDIAAEVVSDLASRASCEESTEVQVLNQTDFTGWDVPISPVVGNTGSDTASIAVAKGYSIASSLMVMETVGVTLEAIFTASLSLSYTETWTTTETTTFTFSVPAGQYGVIVSQPYTHRVQGNVLSGCTDSPTSNAYTADSYTSATYGGLDWVKGPIVLCNSTTYPIPYCVGTGEHS